MTKRATHLFSLILIVLLTGILPAQEAKDFNIRTITAGVKLTTLSDTSAILRTIDFLEGARARFADAGYTVQTIRLSTTSLCEIINGPPDAETLRQIKAIDRIAQKHNVGVSIGELIRGDAYLPNLPAWVDQLVRTTSQINFSIRIASEEYGIHGASIKTAALICQTLARTRPGGEANFRFTASANCPARIPFFPAAFHEGDDSFGIGLESPNLLTRVFARSTWEDAEENLRTEMSNQFRPIEDLAMQLSKETGRYYDGIDSSPAPGLNASIGQAIETLTGKPFGNVSTLNACAIITGAIKNLDLMTCGYSGLMLPVIEDNVLAKRATEKYYTVKELLLLSAVSGTGLDVIPLPGDLTSEMIEGLYRDVAAMSLKYNRKALSVRLFPIPGKKAGEQVDFDNPYLTASTIMELK